MFREPEFGSFGGEEKMRGPSGGGYIREKGVGGQGVRS